MVVFKNQISSTQMCIKMKSIKNDQSVETLYLKFVMFDENENGECVKETKSGPKFCLHLAPKYNSVQIL